MYRKFLENFYLIKPQHKTAPPAPSDGGGMEEQVTTPYLHSGLTKLLLQVRKDLERHEGFREFAYPDVIKTLHKRYPHEQWGFRPARDILADIGVSYAEAVKLGAPWTVGYGFTSGVTPDSRMAKHTADRKLDDLILDKDAQLAAALPWFKDDASFVTKTVLINMVFQMGLAGVLNFRNTLAFIKQHNYKQAASNMRQSLWAKQTPSRASELARRIETQEIPSQYKAPEKI